MQFKNVMLALRNVTAQTRFLRGMCMLGFVFGLLRPRNCSDWSVSSAGVKQQTQEIFKGVCSEKFPLHAILNNATELPIRAINGYNSMNWEVRHAS